MKIRLAQPEEAEQCWKLRNAAIRKGCSDSYDKVIIENWTPEEMPEIYRIEIKNNPFYVAENNEGEIIATGYLDIQRERIEAVFTLPAQMGKGGASAVIQAIRSEAMSRGIKTLTLSATLNGVPFYIKNGFSVIEEKTYYSSLARTDVKCVEMEMAI